MHNDSPDSRPAGGERRHAPLVTVVTIFLNGEKYLSEAVESVLAQRYTNWELMLVDDGSFDRSTEIAREYARRYPERIRYLEHPGHENRGMSASRNLGVRQGHGEYVAFLDSDDVWLPQKLAEHVAILEREPEAGWVAGGLMMWYSWTGTAEDRDRDVARELKTERDTLLRPPRLFCEFLRNGGALPGINSLLIRRAVIEAVGGSDERFRGAYEDQVLMTKLALTSPVYIASGCHDRYRQHADSQTAVDARNGEYHPYLPHRLRRPFLEWVASYVDEHSIEDAEVRRVIDDELRPYRSRTAFASRWMRQALASARSEVRWRVERGVRHLTREYLPTALHAWASRRVYGAAYRPPHRLVDFGSLRRLTPVSRGGGSERGRAVSTYYLDAVMRQHADDIRGCVLEAGDGAYARRFGGHRVSRIDVFGEYAGALEVTHTGTLENASHIPSNAFDCVIIPHALHLVHDTTAALRAVYRILRPGGVALITVPGIVDAPAGEPRARPRWSFTVASLHRLASEALPEAHLTVEPHGNVLTTIALLHGISADELSREELDAADVDYPVIIAIRASKPDC